MLLVVVLVLWLVFARLGAWVAEQKHRRSEEGFVLGLLFGPFGCLIEALLPTLEKVEDGGQERPKIKDWLKGEGFSGAEPIRSPEDARKARMDYFGSSVLRPGVDPSRVQTIEERLQASETPLERQVREHARSLKEAQRLAQQREQDFIAARENEEAWERNREFWRGVGRFWFKFGWFRALPDTIQPILIGLVVAAPIVAVIVKLLGDNR